MPPVKRLEMSSFQGLFYAIFYVTGTTHGVLIKGNVLIEEFHCNHNQSKPQPCNVPIHLSLWLECFRLILFINADDTSIEVAGPSNVSGTPSE